MRSAAIAMAMVICLVPSRLRADTPPFPRYPAFEPGESVKVDQSIFSLVVLDDLEAAPLSDDVPAELEGFWRLGTAWNSFWLKVEGELTPSEHEGEAEAQALYSRLITSFFEAQVGVRMDTRWESRDIDVRAQLAIGLEGLARYFFELEPVLFVSHEGDVSARLEASYDLLITQRMVFTPDLEVNVAVQEVSEWGVGNGLNDVELAARLRYEFIREVAPYLGVIWERKLFETADLARDAGEPVSDVRFLTGARIWF